MNLLLAEVALALPLGTHAVLLMDNAGWHIADELVVPPTITLVPLPPYSPELNAIERVWLHLRDRFLSNTVFPDVDAVIDACCDDMERPPRRYRTHPIPLLSALGVSSQKIMELV